jgi:pimeloyl-ACP methyl ester carboxylesterase
MRRLRLKERSLAVQERGEGAPLLLLHPGFIADGMLPLFADGTLAAGRRLVRYHRCGYGQSDSAKPPVSLARQAGDALAVLDALDVERTDLVGHSFGANVALELAISAPERVRSLVLMEPLLAFALAPDAARYVAEAAEVALPLYQRGNPAGAVDAWLSRAFGPGYREVLERALPGALDRAIHDADAAFAVEMPSLQPWPRGPEDLRRIGTRALSVVNASSDWPGFRETHEALLAWLPNIEAAVVPDCGHLLQIEQPALVAAAVGDFLGAEA